MKKILLYAWIPLVFIVTPFIYGLIVSPKPLITEAEKDNIALRFDDDKCIEQAQKDAQLRLDEFKASLSRKTDQFSFSVKTAFNGEVFKNDIDTEHMWVWVDSYNGKTFDGRLANDPAYIKNLKLGDQVSVEDKKVEDWIIRNIETNEYVGGFSVECLNKLSN